MDSRVRGNDEFQDAPSWWSSSSRLDWPWSQWPRRNGEPSDPNGPPSAQVASTSARRRKPVKALRSAIQRLVGVTLKHQLVENHVLRWRDRYSEAHQFDRPSAIEPAAGKRTPAGEIDIRANSSQPPRACELTGVRNEGGDRDR